MDQETYKQIPSTNYANASAANKDMNTDERKSPSHKNITENSHQNDFDLGQRTENTPDIHNETKTRFESEECAVLLSLPEREASLLGEEIRDVLLQPVDHQPSSSAAALLNQPALTAEEYDKRHNLNIKPSCSRNSFLDYYDSPSARLPTLTLTRDVPEQSDEPLAAVSVVCLQSRASISTLFTSATQSNPTRSPFNSVQSTTSTARSTNRIATVRTGRETTPAGMNYNKTSTEAQTSSTNIILRPHCDSPSARPPTPTPTRDVPEQSDEPLAAVGVVCSLPRASIDSFSPLNQPNTSVFPTNLECNYTPDSSPRNSADVNLNNITTRSPQHTFSDAESDTSSPRKTPSFAIQWNICGLRSHQHELQLLTRNYRPVVIS